MVHTTG